jgi:hypothetical protein
LELKPGFSAIKNKFSEGEIKESEEKRVDLMSEYSNFEKSAENSSPY